MLGSFPSESWSVCAAKFTRLGEEPTLLSNHYADYPLQHMHKLLTDNLSKNSRKQLPHRTARGKTSR